MLSDLTGCKYGSLLVVGFDHFDTYKHSYWKCRCDCGNDYVVRGSSLTEGKTTACNACSHKIKDMVGEEYGRLTVLSFDGVRKGHYYWKCVCECGNEVVVDGGMLRSGNTKSCGCYQRERTSSANKTHGDTGERLFGIWMGMKDRCYNANCPGYRYYGGKGVTVFDGWRYDYPAFKSWSYANGYADSLTIDRIDVNGSYCPDNCRWITLKEQQNNKTVNHLVIYHGKSRTVSEWSDIVGIDYKTLYQRLFKYHWDVESAFTKPVRHSNRRKESVCIG